MKDKLENACKDSISLAAFFKKKSYFQLLRSKPVSSIEGENMAFLSSVVTYSTGVRAPAIGTMRRMTESAIAEKDPPSISYIITYTFIFGGILVSLWTQ